MRKHHCRYVLNAVGLLILCAQIAMAVKPVVKVVPWDPNNPLTPHDTYSGKMITLKGTSDVPSYDWNPFLDDFEYTWDFGDGTPAQTGKVSPYIGDYNFSWQRGRYAIDATHIYAAPEGTLITARLTVRDNRMAQSTTVEYYIAIRAKALPVEVNVAIDEGLWYLHKTMSRYMEAGLEVGDWEGGCPLRLCFASGGASPITASNVHAFLAHGHREDGNPANPYTETVARGMKGLFRFLSSVSIPSSIPNYRGTFNPDTNSNGSGVREHGGSAGVMGAINAIIAAGTPNRIVATGESGIIGRMYKTVVQDMVDAFLACQYYGPQGGGWDAVCNGFPDNYYSFSPAIGLLRAERDLGIPIPGPVEAANEDWTTYSQDSITGVFGWGDGPWAVRTASGMVQLAWTGIGRGNPRWDKAETLMRDNFGNAGGPVVALRDYYRALLSFTQAMLVHDSNDDGIAEPITLLQSSTPGINPIDWYAAEVALGSPTDGVARKLVNDQSTAGYWSGHMIFDIEFPFDTASALIMLRRTAWPTPGSITIIKDAVPDDAQDFSFTTTGGAPLGGGFSLDDDANATLTNTQVFSNVPPGSYSVTEGADPSGWQFTSLYCIASGTGTSVTTSGKTASITIAAGGNVTCTYTNTKRAILRISKATIPAGDATSFTFTPTGLSGGTAFALSHGQTFSSGFLLPNIAYSATENVPNNFSLTGQSCVFTGTTTPHAFGTPANGVSVLLLPGEDVICTFTNTKLAQARVRKTFQTQPITGTEIFTFSLRQGAIATASGNPLQTLVANSANGGMLNFSPFLTPGTTYQACEVVRPGWSSSMTSLPSVFVIQTEPDGDNSSICFNFTPTPGETTLFAIDNTPPPGGNSRTTGFWKNWASCSASRGNQGPVLDQTLAAAGGSFLIGDVVVDTCLEAVALLNKSDISSGKKRANDAGFNLAAQLLAAKLNIVAGAASCAAANTAIASTQALLDLVNFSGIDATAMTSAQATLANDLAATLGRYNNNLLCP
ncbi:MAG: hypothetical protein HY820_13105 [Acidobacteria bacterium]|nr:hypothetical protein [Acidobacteriota bacterium]